VTQSCNLTWESETGRITIQSQPGQKVHKTPSQSMSSCGGTHLSFLLPSEAQIRLGPGWPGHEVRLYLKNNQHKKDSQSGSSGRVPA
jgi:hypothetical protein